MKSVIATSLALVSLTSALPSHSADPIRTLPFNWSFEITSLRGPGCPDFSDPSNDYSNTRLTFGKNTVDGSEIYYWFVAYPYLRVELGGEEHSWCETVLAYKEFKDLDFKKESAEYRLRMHKNGTRAIATYDLDEGVEATFKFAYDDGNDEITDTIALAGPLTSGQYAQESSSTVSTDSKPYQLPKCGANKIKFRTDLYISGKKGQKGFVASEHSKNKEGKEHYYGTQQGFSYDWEKCGDQ